MSRSRECLIIILIIIALLALSWVKAGKDIENCGGYRQQGETTGQAVKRFHDCIDNGG